VALLKWILIHGFDKLYMNVCPIIRKMSSITNYDVSDIWVDGSSRMRASPFIRHFQRMRSVLSWSKWCGLNLVEQQGAVQPFSAILASVVHSRASRLPLGEMSLDNVNIVEPLSAVVVQAWEDFFQLSSHHPWRHLISYSAKHDHRTWKI
jgi:hypothetical protein